MPADITSALWGCATWSGSSRLRIFWAYPHFTRTAQQVRIFLTTLKTRSLWRLRCLSRVNVRGLRLCSSFTMRHHSMKNVMLPSASFLASWTRSNHQQKNRPFQLSFPIRMYTRYVWRVILVFDPFQTRTFDSKKKECLTDFSQTELILPRDIYNAIWESVDSKLQSLQYAKVILPLSSLLEGEFFNKYIKTSASTVSILT